jgi:hypothetical protein
MLSLGPSPRLLHGPPDVGSSLGTAGIAGDAFEEPATLSVSYAADETLYDAGTF